MHILQTYCWSRFRWISFAYLTLRTIQWVMIFLFLRWFIPKKDESFGIYLMESWEGRKITFLVTFLNLKPCQGNIVFYMLLKNLFTYAGLKVNDQLVAYATRFSAVRLKNYLWSHHHTLKAKVQCNFSSAYSPDHTNVLRLINTNLNIDIKTARHQIIKLHHFLFIGACSIYHL